MKSIYIIMVILMAAACYADSSPNAIVDIAVQTSGNINSTITQTGDNVNSNIFCNGNTCNTNMFGGSLFLAPNNSQAYNIYTSQQITRVGSGMSMSSLISQMVTGMTEYFSGKQSSNEGYNLWAILDYVFVSHKESVGIYTNVDYLALERDRLVAENRILKAYLNISFSPLMLECQTALETAKRTNQVITTEHGMIAEPNALGSTCITIKSKSSPINKSIVVEHNSSINKTQVEARK